MKILYSNGFVWVWRVKVIETQKLENFKFLKYLQKIRKQVLKVKSIMKQFWGGRKEPDIWMNKYNFTHVPCPLIREIRNRAPHSHFDERFSLRTLARWHSIPLLLMQVGIAHRTLWAAWEQRCCALLTFPMAPGSWVSRGSPTEKKCGCCGHAAQMGPGVCRGGCWWSILSHKILLWGKAHWLIPATTNTVTAENHHSSTTPRRLKYVQWLHRVLSWGL